MKQHILAWTLFAFGMVAIGAVLMYIFAFNADVSHESQLEVQGVEQKNPAEIINEGMIACTADSDCAYLKSQESCYINGGVITLTPYCIDGYCECRCSRNDDALCD